MKLCLPTQQKVLCLLYGHTERSFYLNELIHLAGMGRGTIKRELDKLSDVGLITEKKQGNKNQSQTLLKPSGKTKKQEPSNLFSETE